jgi:hypothetical protein
MDMGTVLFMAAVLVFVILVFPRLQRKAGRQHEGWKYLTVSIAEWLMCVLALGLTCLFLWVYYFVGSARADAAHQMFILQLLIVGFAVITAVAWWTTFSSFTCWNKDCIEQDTVLLGVRRISFSQIDELHYESWSNSGVIDGTNGARIRIPLMHNGAQELVVFVIDFLLQPQSSG